MNKNFDSEEFYNQAWLFHKTKRYQDAITSLKESLALKEHYKSYELLAVCCQEIDKISEALEYLEQAYKLNEKSSKTACLLAQLLLDSGDNYRSKTIAEKVLENHKDYGPARRILEKIAN